MSSPSFARAPRAGLRRRLMAWVLASSGARMHRLFGERKARLLGALTGTVLELGPGAGANFRYFSPGVRWVGVEPNLHNLPYLRREAARFGLLADARPGYAEALPLPDASVDHVVSTLVLCSVADVAVTLQEVRRVLRSGGSYVFMEHVAAPRGTLTRRLQDAAAPLWGLLADGCHPNRELAAAITGAGFASVQVEAFDVSLPLVRPHIAGAARQP